EPGYLARTARIFGSRFAISSTWLAERKRPTGGVSEASTGTGASEVVTVVVVVEPTLAVLAVALVAVALVAVVAAERAGAASAVVGSAAKTARTGASVSAT